MLVIVAIGIILFKIAQIIKQKIKKRNIPANAPKQKLTTLLSVVSSFDNEEEEKRKKEAYQQKLTQWKNILSSPDVTIEQADDIYNKLPEEETLLCDMAKNIIIQKTRVLLENTNITLAELKRIRDKYIFSNTPEEDIVDKKISEFEKKEKEEELKTVFKKIAEVELHKDNITKLLAIAEEINDDDNLAYQRAVDYIEINYFKQVKEAEDKLYGNIALTDKERAALKELIDDIAEQDYDCAAKELAQELIDDEYGENYSLEQEILDPTTSLQRLQEIHDEESLEDHLDTLLNERLNNLVYIRLLEIKSILDTGANSETTEKLLEEIDEMNQYVFSNLSADMLSTLIKDQYEQ